MPIYTAFLIQHHIISSIPSQYFCFHQTGIQNVYAGLLSEQRIPIIVALQVSGKRVCIVGDGVNITSALKTADGSTALGAMGNDCRILPTINIAIFIGCIHIFPVSLHYN